MTYDPKLNDLGTPVPWKMPIAAAAEATPTVDVTQCPDCGESGRYDGRVLVRGRGVYTCPDGHRWQDLDEIPNAKGYIAISG